MDLAITDFVKRSAEIAFGATKGSLKDYGKNVGELVTASKDIKDKLMPEVKNAKQAFSSMKRSGPISSISNWFYSKEYEIGDGDDMLNDTDEFDSGNPNLNDDSSESSSTVLDASTAKGLARSQVSAMYRIGSKQTEASVANTAEIISNMSQRSADMIAAINNVNSTLINISSKMDNLITLLSPQQGVQDVNHNSIYDSSGRISLGSISSALGNRASSTFGSSKDMVSMLKRAFTPEEVFRMTVVDRVFNKNLNALGGRSIDEMGKAFNKASGDAIQSILNTALQNTPLGDFLLKGNSKSFADVSSQNQYTKDAAVFDKATRHTIVSIIPEYLKKITEAVTGQKWNIDERGTVTTKTVANPFKQAGSAILGASINYNSMNRLNTTIEQYSNQTISSQDQSAAVNALLIVYILQEKYNNPRQIINDKQINNTFMTSPNRRQYTEMAVNIFVQNSMISDKNRAREIINTVWTYLATDRDLARSFAQAVNSNYDKMYQAGKTIDANNPLAHQYANDSSISYDDMLKLVQSANVKGMLQYDYDYNAEYERLRKQYGGRSTFSDMKIKHKLTEWDKENRSKYLKNEEEEVTSRIGQANVSGKSDNSFFAQQKKLFASLTKYTHGIYDILNSGVVNVRMVGQPVRRAVRNHREVRVRTSFGDGGSSSTDDGGGADEPPQPSTDTPQPLQILPTAGYTGEMSASERAFNAAMGYGSQATTTVRNFLSGGPVGMLRNEVSNIGTDIHAVGNRAIQLKSNQLHLDSMQRNVAGSNNISERDKMKFQAINTAINTAMQDGSGTEDKGKIRSMIQEIEDPELRRDLEKTSSALLTAHSEKVQPTSKLGKLLSMAKPVLSLVLAPIKKVLGLMLTGLKKYWSWTKKMWASGARDIVRGGRQIRQGLFGNREYTDKYGITHAASRGAIRSIGGGLIGMNRGIINGMPDGLTLTGDAINLVGGIRNAGSSFIAGVRGGQYSDAPSSLPQRGDYGSRQEFNDAMRDYRRDSVSSTFGKLGEKLRNSKLGQDVANISESNAVKKFTKMISKVTSGLKKFGSAIGKVASFIASVPGKLAKGAEWLGGKANKFTSWVGKGVQKVEDRIANSAVGNAITQSATFQGAKALVGNVFSAPGRALSGAGQFISGVGAGFRESMAEAKRDKQQARLKAQGPQTIADQETESINRKLETGEGKFFTSVLDLLTSISTNTEKAAEPDESSSSGNSQSTENNAGGNNDQEIHTTDIPSGPTNSLAGNMDRNNAPSYGESGTDAPGPSAEGGDSGGAKGAGKGIGKMLGGIMSVLGGIMKIVGPVLMAMEGIQMIQKLVQETLTKVLKPLDKIFKKLFKVLSPILDTLTKSLEPLMDCIVTVLDGIITPLAPVIQGIFEAVSPLLEIVAGLVEVIMVPLMAIFDRVLVPIIKQIGSAVKVIMGVVQMGFGALMVPLGGIMALIGKLPLVGGSGIGSKGKEIAQMGKDMIKGGAQMAVEGVKEFVAATLERLTLGIVGGDTEEKEEEKPSNVYQSQDASTYNPGALEGLMASGDSTVVNNYYQNTYGSGNTTYNQHSYSSSGLNMHDHGCGPIALADRVNRTLGGRVDPNALAKSMAASGNYSSTRGTSIAGMLNTGRALGMNMQVGGVTPQSLSQATPNNPITVIGSGIGYDTRDGNNHFMNVLGTNGSGMAYVSNPMTGRVSRTPLNQLALHSKLGLYGSGDIEDNFNFGEGAKNAFSELKNLWTGITNLFNFESGESQADKMRKQKEELDQESYIASVKAHHTTAEWDAAYQEYIAENPQEEGEKDNDYKKRAEYAVAQKLAEEYKSGISVDEMMGTFNSFGQNLIDYADNEVNDDPISGSTTGDGTFTSPDGKAVLALSDPTITDVDMKATDEDGLYTHAPILEFFARAAGHKAYIGPSNWYTQYGTAVDHDKNGKGTSGAPHEGVDIHWVGESTSIPIVAPTDGTFYAAIDEAHGGGGGNYVEFVDASGMHHRFLHMSKFSDAIKKMKQGDPIVGGETVLGYEGYTGSVDPPGSGGIHLHYDVSTNGYGSNIINPLTYWKYNPITGAASLKDYEKSAFMQQSNTVFRASNADVNKRFFEAAKQAGLTTEQTAGIMAASIIENPENIYGSRSLTATAYDADGSGARKGLFSWAAGDAVGSTLLDQLKYIYGYLYDPKTTDFRAYVRNYDFDPSTSWSGNTEHTTYLAKYVASTGKQPHLKNGEKYGAYATTDPIEGAAQLEMNAIVPTGLTTALMNTLLRSTADAYNWATSNGFGAAKTDPSSSAPKEWKANSPGDAKLLENIRNAGTSSGENTGTVNVQEGSYLNLREGPNTNSAVLAEIPAGTTLKYKYDGNNGWLKLIDPYNGKTGYISADYVLHAVQEDGAAIGNVTTNSAMSGSSFNWKGSNNGPAISGPVTLEQALKSASSNVYGPQLPSNLNNNTAKKDYKINWWNPVQYKQLPKSILNSPNAVTEMLKSKADALAKKNWDAMNFVELRNLGTRFDKEKYPTAWFKDFDYIPWVEPWGDEKQSNYMDPDNVWNRYIREYQNNGPYASRFSSHLKQLKQYADMADMKLATTTLSLPASGDASIMDVPPIDYNDLGFGNSEQQSAQAIPTQYIEINKYNSPTDDQIDRLLAHEFKVSDEKNAAILNKIYAILLELNGGKEGAPTTDGGIPIDQMFNNEIPESIYRLSRG